MDVWWAYESVVEFMRFVNVDEDPEPDELQIRYLASNNNALRVPLVGHPEASVAQEPSLVELPDGRLFCVMRTTTGSPYWTVSDSGGETWSQPAPLCEYDDGPRLLHPCSPCPIYPMEDGRYVLFHHNHDGHFESWGPRDTSWHRRPIYIRYGAFKRNAGQPVHFSEPQFFMDNGGTPLGYGAGRTDLALYASTTRVGDVPVLWYPDRKYFLLGKRITTR
jgi:hypothetical protein